MQNRFYARRGKRAFDLISSVCGILFLSPIFILATLAVKLSTPGPVLFSHRRIGRDFKPFSAYKFRTMVVGAHKNGAAITTGGDVRITTVGRLLRKTKVDELPQLFNVLFGDMSLVGPRPEVSQYVSLFEADYKTVLSVRPGITDYAAIEYRDEENLLSELIIHKYSTTHDAYIKEVLPAKITLYKKYIAEQSFLTDLMIIFKTLSRILK